MQKHYDARLELEETLYTNVNGSRLSTLCTLIINQDYSTASVLLSPNTCREVSDERVFAHRHKNLWTPHQGSCVDMCVFNVALSRRSPDNKNLCWDMTRHLPEQTHIQIHMVTTSLLVCVRLTTVFSFLGPTEPGMKNMFFAKEGNSYIVSKQLKWGFTTWTITSLFFLLFLSISHWRFRWHKNTHNWF